MMAMMTIDDDDDEKTATTTTTSYVMVLLGRNGGTLRAPPGFCCRHGYFIDLTRVPGTTAFLVNLILWERSTMMQLHAEKANESNEYAPDVSHGRY